MLIRPDRKRAFLSRRTFLRGSVATAIGLPLLEAMMDDHGTALADGSSLPCRFILFYTPTALVSSSGRLDEGFTPAQTGFGFGLPYCLEPLSERGVAEDVSAISNLFVAPFDAPGGYDRVYHSAAVHSTLSGQRHGFGPGNFYDLAGTSVDQVVSQAIGEQTPFPHLVYQVDPSNSGGLSFAERSNGSYAYVQAQTSPLQAYRNLFTGFTPPDDSAPVDDLEQRLRVSSLSHVRGQIASLQARLGTADRERLEFHLHEVRALETRLGETIGGTPAGTSCAVPSFPDSDPGNLGGLPDQETRALLFNDLIQMALACDLTRTVALYMSDKTTGEGMPHPAWNNGVGGLHHVQHFTNNASLNDANRLIVGYYADLLSKLKALSEGPGNLLDRTAAVFCMEGGKAGRMADGGGDPNHSTDNMVSLLAGRAGGLVPGQHVLANEDHQAIVFNTAIRAVGLDLEVGDIRGHLTALFSEG